jgi:hypothetical protein
MLDIRMRSLAIPVPRQHNLMIILYISFDRRDALIEPCYLLNSIAFEEVLEHKMIYCENNDT